MKKLKSYLKNCWLNVICSSPLVPISLRRHLLRLCGHHVTKLFSNCFLGEGPGHLYVGKGSFCNHGCFFDLGSDIHIGNHCCVAMNVSFLNGTHEVGFHTCRGGRYHARPTIVRDGCWIGAGATILPGVTVGEGCIVAAGAVVAQDCEPDWLYAGIPARKIKKLK